MSDFFRSGQKFKNPKKPSKKISTPVTAPTTNQENSHEDNKDIHCYCQKLDSGNMIGCENDDCEHQWFHPGCLGMVKLPDEDEVWFCPDCREKSEIQEKIKELEEGKGDIHGMTKVNLDGMRLKVGRGKGVAKIVSKG